MQPLQGIRVIDLSHAVSGPFCTYQLALLGADVIKVERPDGGDPLRGYTEHAGAAGMSTPFMTINGGKRSIVLDLKTPAGVAALRRLVAGADVLVENFRPGVTRHLGFDPDTLRAVNPDLVYCSISGFGQNGPLRDWTAYDHIVQAMSGLMSVNGEPDGEPVKLGVPISDTFAGYMAAFAVMAALMQRERGPRAAGDTTRRGQHIDVSMLDASMVLLNQSITTYLYGQEPPRRRGNQGFRLTPTADSFPVKDGHIALGVNHQNQFARLCRVVGTEWMLQDQRFADHTARAEHAAELRAELIAVFSHWRATDLEDQLAREQIPVSVVRTVPEILQHPHLRGRELLMPATASGHGEFTTVGAGYQFLDGDGPALRRGVPALGEHTDEVLAELATGGPATTPAAS